MRQTTRATLPLIAALAAAVGVGPAAAQVQQGNPNAANQSLSNMGAARTTQQNQMGQSNTTMMNAERSRNAPPEPSAPTAPAPRGIGR